MIELCAITYSDVGAAIRHQRHASERPTLLGTCAKYYSECGRAVKGLAISLWGDELINQFAYDTPEISIICRTDLLIRDSRLHAEYNVYPARFLASLYEQQGDLFVRELRGTFAIILYDKKARVLKSWTDPFGSERLVFTNPQGFTAVATDLRLLLPLFTERPDIDPVAVQQYLQYTCIPAPKTIFRGISRLEPGHQLTSGTAVATRSYWDMTYAQNEDRTEKAWIDETENALRSAVSLNMTGLEPSRMGCFLSGGTDSSSIVGMLSQLTTEPARTFSIGFDDSRYNEMHYARITARHNKSSHHEYFVTPNDVLALIQRAVPAYDEPFGNSSIIPTYYCARLAAENGVTHLLAGDGGDELFGGNSRYADDRVFQHYSELPIWMQRLVIEPAVSLGNSWTRLRFFDLAARYIRRSKISIPDRWFSYSLLSSVPNQELVSSDFLASVQGQHPLEPARRHFASAPSRHPLNRYLYLDLKITIGDNDLRKVTVMSQLAGVTARYPMLDPTLAQFTGTIPPHLKVRKSQLRYLFKKSMAGVLPPAVIKKQKHGFGLPYCIWVGERGPLQDFTFDVLGSTRCRQRGYFRPDLFEWLWSQYDSVHQKFYGDLLWVFMMLELWHLKHDEAAMARQQQEVVPLSTGVN
ncbi:MAG: asparagine synthase [Acidobacteria bacterium]|nr:MAG: asparagine synthase [Acidobacteriota bacterium]